MGLQDVVGNWEFPKIGVPYYGDLIIRILLFRVLYWGRGFWGSLGPGFNSCFTKSSAVEGTLKKRTLNSRILIIKTPK